MQVREQDIVEFIYNGTPRSGEVTLVEHSAAGEAYFQLLTAENTVKTFRFDRVDGGVNVVDRTPETDDFF